MPNWCNNTVVITHQDAAKLEALASAVREGKFCHYAIPTPEDLNIVAGSLGRDTPEQAELERKSAENVEKYGYANWYDFQVAKWGTKWDVESYEGSDTKVVDGALQFGFDSAWAPPCGVYAALEEQGFTVKAYYYEPGMCFAGRWEDGFDDYYELSNMSSEQVREELPEDLDEMMGISESMAEWEEENEED